VFFDKNNLSDIRQLETEVKNSVVLLQIQSAELYYRPFTLIEAATAFEYLVKVIPVATMSYDFKKASDFLGSADFCAELDNANPGAVEVIRKAGHDPVRVGRVVADEFPSLRSYKYNASETPRVMEGQLADILEQVLKALGVA
jgi:hypothetical protein